MQKWVRASRRAACLGGRRAGPSRLRVNEPGPYKGAESRLRGRPQLRESRQRDCDAASWGGAGKEAGGAAERRLGGGVGVAEGVSGAANGQLGRVVGGAAL